MRHEKMTGAGAIREFHYPEISPTAIRAPCSRVFGISPFGVWRTRPRPLAVPPGWCKPTMMIFMPTPALMRSGWIDLYFPRFWSLRSCPFNRSLKHGTKSACRHEHIGSWASPRRQQHRPERDYPASAADRSPGRCPRTRPDLFQQHHVRCRNSTAGISVTINFIACRQPSEMPWLPKTG